MAFWDDALQGTKDAFDYLGLTHFAEKEKSAALEQQFQQMSEAYRQYRLLNADAQQRQLQASLAARKPQQQLVGDVLPGYGFENSTAGVQGLFDQTVTDIKANAGGYNPNAWPVVSGQRSNAPTELPPITGSYANDPNFALRADPSPIYPTAPPSPVTGMTWNPTTQRFEQR